MKRNVAKCILSAGLALLTSAHQHSFASSTGQESSGESSPPGVSVFRKSCTVCHSIRSGETKVGPSLYGVLRRDSGRSEQEVRQTIVEGKAAMPAFKQKLEQNQIDDLIRYLKSL